MTVVAPMMNNEKYYATATWWSRPDTPEQLAKRWTDMLESLEMVHPIFKDWYSWLDEDAPVERVDTRPNILAARIRAGCFEDDEDGLDLSLGFRWHARNTDSINWGPRYFSVNAIAGQNPCVFNNFVRITTDPGRFPDPDVVTYEIFRGALLALAEAFDASQAIASPTSIFSFRPKLVDEYPRLPLGWISYVGPRFAHLIKPPAAAIIEYRPNGGLLMAATADTFRTDNPKHVTVAREIVASAAPLNRILKAAGNTPP